MFLVGTSKLLGIYNSPAFIILGLAIMGFGCCMIIIPVLPDMIAAVEERHPHLNQQILHNQISGLFIAFQGVGETLGPVFGSTSENIYGFRITQDIIGCALLTFMVLYFLFCGGFSILSTNPSPPISEAMCDNSSQKEQEKGSLKSVQVKSEQRRSAYVEFE
jgi:hypothetical protein